LVDEDWTSLATAAINKLRISKNQMMKGGRIFVMKDESKKWQVGEELPKEKGKLVGLLSNGVCL
jgi:hypothetical protein